ncbi:unnamed protein product [Tenebrio molitor]|nr:unnamed protein product [Tenebrio molitor]
MRKIKDNAIRKEINSVSLQICHEKVEIGVCGLFTIDYKLLFAILSSVVTHLILLVQIQENYLK